MANPKIFVLNGPNLNMLGKREPEVYGSHTLEQINQELAEAAAPLGLDLEFFQSNHEGALVDRIQEIFDLDPAGIIINPGALYRATIHTVALLDLKTDRLAFFQIDTDEEVPVCTTE